MSRPSPRSARPRSAAPCGPRARAKIKWRMQTYAGGPLSPSMSSSRPSILSTRSPNDEMEIELFFADQLVPTGELFRAMQKGTIDAVQSRRRFHGFAPVEVTRLWRLLPLRLTRYSLDVPVLFNQYGLGEIWDAEPIPRSRTSSGSPPVLGTPVTLQHQGPHQQPGGYEGQAGLHLPNGRQVSCQRNSAWCRSSLPWEDIEVAVQTGELDGIAWSGITEDYTVGWADVTNYFLTNNISGAWCGFLLRQYRTAMERSCRRPPERALEDHHGFSSHYYRQWWYWGGESAAAERQRHQDETHHHSRPGVGRPWKAAAKSSSGTRSLRTSETKAKRVVQILKDYADALMDKAGKPYRYSLTS